MGLTSRMSDNEQNGKQREHQNQHDRDSSLGCSCAKELTECEGPLFQWAVD